MDAIFPALIGLGLWLAYEAWTNPDPTPIAKITAALSGNPLSGSGTAASPYSVPGTAAPATAAGTAAAVGASGFNTDTPQG